MFRRHLKKLVLERLEVFPAVALLGPRQVGKTTLAHQIAEGRPSIYLDLEAVADRAKLDDPELYLAGHRDKLVILDEIQRVPELFQALRGIIDAGRREGRKAGQFLLLGSASNELLHQSSESLAGRIAYLELGPLDVREIEDRPADTLWQRGGFPDSFLAASDGASIAWRSNFIRTYLERDIPALGPRIPAETLRRFWTMLAHQQGGLLNTAELGRNLAVDARTVGRYLDLLVYLLLVRRLHPWHANTNKRLVKSPKVFVRDSGLVHALLGIADGESLLGHPVVGGSWEGFAIENLCNAAPPETKPYFYRTATGDEIDLLLDIPGKGLWAIEIKRGLAPQLTKGFHAARMVLQPERCLVVYAGTERYPLAEGVEAMGLREAVAEVAG